MKAGYWRDGEGSEKIAHLAALPEQSPNPVLELDDRGLLYANPAALALFPDLRERGEGHPLISTGRRVASEIRGTGSGTTELELEGASYGLDVSLEPETGETRVYVSDVTEHREAWRLAAESERRFQQLFDNTVEAVFLHDSEGHIVECNAEACTSLGYTREELLSLSVEDIAADVLPEEDRIQRADTPWRKALRTGPGIQSSFHKNEHRRKDGTTFPVEIGMAAMDYGGKRLVLASARDISGRRRLEEELAHRTHHDPLTNLPNRELLDIRLKNALARARRYERRMTVMFLRVGGLDQARERLGYRAGDRMLLEVARRISGCLGPEDTVGRIGGEDLAVLAEGAGDGEQAVQTVLEILKDLRDPLPLEDGEVRAGITAGAALTPRDYSGGSSDPLDEAYESMCRARLRGDSYELAP